MALKKESALANKHAERRTASEKFDQEFFAARRVKEAENLQRTLELRASRLAHQAQNAPPVKRARSKALPQDPN